MPDIPAEEVKGVAAAKLGLMQYEERFNVVGETESSRTYQYSGSPVDSPERSDDTDASLLRRGYAAISMIKYDLNDYEGLNTIKKWRIKL